MQITFLNPVGVIGGAERVLLSAIRATRDHWPDSRVGLILIADGPLRSEAEALGASVTIIPLPARIARQGDTQLRGKSWARTLMEIVPTAFGLAPDAVDFVWRLRAALHRLEPDLIHSNGLKTHILSVLARPAGIPVLWHLHDFPSHRPVMARLLQRLVKYVACGIAVSDAVASDSKAVFPDLSVTVIRNATNTDDFFPGDRNGNGLDSLAGLPLAAPGTVRVGLIATYANWKGHDVYLEALARLKLSESLIRAYIIGGPIYTTTGSQFSELELRELTNQLGLSDHVGFIPYQSDPADIYRMLDVVVHASTRPEPFGLTIVEAMACGRPVVVAAAGGATELFTPEYDGLSHVPGDAEELSIAIARLATDTELRFRLGSNARRTALERFSHDRYAREIASVFSRCL